jgi:hypothetical protein
MRAGAVCRSFSALAFGNRARVRAVTLATFVEDTHERARRRSASCAAALTECEHGKHKGHWSRPYALPGDESNLLHGGR